METNIHDDGFSMVTGVLSMREREEFIKELGPVAGAGRRCLLRHPKVAAFAESPRLLDLVRTVLCGEPKPVRAIFFDKSPTANWGVPWHQDLTLAVETKLEAPGFGPWSVKEEIPHVQPPIELLEQMLTIRLHLDKATESNGGLWVIPGTHKLGRLSAPEIQRIRSSQVATLCAAEAGDGLMMRPLLLHASNRSTNSGHRRILHIEYAAFDLPHGLKWHKTG